MAIRYIFSIFLLAFLCFSCDPGKTSNREGQETKVLQVFLVRHAEKVDQSYDPELTPAGYVRAATLAQTLHSAEITQVHSTDFIRTRKTAEPLAAINGLEVEIYDPSDLKALSEKLLELGGRHLVVGHSNTTPRMVDLLGGDPGLDVIADEEYDRLYLVSVSRGGEVSTLLLRYGAAYIPSY